MLIPFLQVILNNLVKAWESLQNESSMISKGLEEARGILDFNNEVSKVRFVIIVFVVVVAAVVIVVVEFVVVVPSIQVSHPRWKPGSAKRSSL